ncbi:MAG: hypothetical protein Hals2KO_03980 [Halioglobus sp.]
MSVNVQQIAEQFPVLKPDMGIEALPWTGGMEFYENMESHFGTFASHVLVSCHSFNEPWPTWECHLKGDELVLLMSGSATMVLLIDGEQQTLTLSEPGAFVTVPRGVWHTSSAADNAQMLFITPGEGTENLETPPGL